MNHEIIVPFLGEAVPEAKVSRILINEGDTLKYDEVYIHLSTDKTDIEVPSEQSGKVEKVCVKVGQPVKVGDVLLILESELDKAQAASKADRANVQAGLLYLSTKEADYLCSRGEMGRFTFPDHRSFVEDTIEIARTFRSLPLEKLDSALLDELKENLFFITDLIQELVGFNPAQLGVKKLTEHTRISQRLQKDQEQALQLFTDILARTRDELEDHEQPRKGWVRGQKDRAYVFISYSHKDKKHADDLATRLRSAGIQYFLDSQSIAAGETIDVKVYEALNHASHMVALISPGSEDSEWVPYEMGYARAKNLILVSYLLHESMKLPSFAAKEKCIKGPSEVPDFIRRLKDYRRTFPDAARARERFSEWNCAAAQERLKTANEICHQAVSGYTFFNEAFAQIVEVIRRGGTLRCILVDPYGKAIQMAKFRAVGAEANLDYMRSQIDFACEKLNEFAQYKPGAVELKVIDHLPEPVMTIMDPDASDGTMFVTLNGFEKRLPSRPSFVLRRESDEHWFDFYYDSFKNLWKHKSCKCVDLNRGVVRVEE